MHVGCAAYIPYKNSVRNLGILELIYSPTNPSESCVHEIETVKRQGGTYEERIISRF